MSLINTHLSAQPKQIFMYFCFGFFPLLMILLINLFLLSMGRKKRIPVCIHTHQSNLETEEHVCLRRHLVHILKRCLGDDGRPLKFAASKQRSGTLNGWNDSIYQTF